MKRSLYILLAVGALALLFRFVPIGIDSAVEKVVKTCAGEPDRALCYENTVPALLDIMSLEHVFSVVRLLRHTDTSYQFCHVLAHKLGERVVAKDPAKWLDAIALNPQDGLCSNGFIHGVIGGKFRAEVLDGETLDALIPDFSLACEPRENWRASLLDQAMCYHGMGHLYVFITDADIPAALALCEKTSRSSTGDFRRVCIEGVFMQLYQPLEPDDFLMLERMQVKPTPGTERAYCALFEKDEYEGACLRESWPYSRNQLLEEEGAAVRFCSGQPNQTEEQACYDTVFSVLGRQTLGRSSLAVEQCLALPDDLKEECVGRVALSYLEEDREDGAAAVGFCRALPGEDTEHCLSFLAARASFVFGTDEIRLWKFCSRLPSVLRKECITNPETGISLTGIVHLQ